MATPSPCPVYLVCPSFLSSASATLSPKCPHCQRGEHNALSPALLFCYSHLSAVGLIGGVAQSSSRPCHCGPLEGVGHRGNPGCVSSPGPVGRKTSACLLSLPGRRNLTTLEGPREAATAVLCRASRRVLCLAILSPSLPHHKAWSPSLSLGDL